VVHALLARAHKPAFVKARVCTLVCSIVQKARYLGEEATQNLLAALKG